MMSKRRIIHALALVLGLSLGQTAVAQSQAAAGDPGIFIEQLASQAIKVLSSPNGSLREREERFRDLLRDDFAMEQIARFVAGPYWRKMSTAQKDSYEKLFSEWVLKTYAVRLGGYSGEQFQVLKSTPAGERDVIVYTRISKSGGNGFDANWRVRRAGDRYKIIDIYVEGVSMAITQRSEFDSIFRRQGVDGLIGMLRDKVTKLSNSSQG
jgi:phospholipid transport system substrate-binding protein